MNSPHSRYSGRRLQRGQSWCTSCQHISHPTKAAAKRTIREMRSQEPEGAILRAFPCPRGNGFHAGHDRHIEQAVIDEANGITSPPRRAWDPPAAPRRGGEQ